MAAKHSTFRISIALSTLFTTSAMASSHFDSTKRVVLPSENAKTILEWYAPDRLWVMSDWSVTTEDLDRLENSLGDVLAQAKVDSASKQAASFYRQYMPARWKGLHLIVVNGFRESAAEMFPDKGIDPNEWQQKLTVAFGGGCAFWRAVYVVERNNFMTLESHGVHAKVLCNGVK